MKKFDIRSIYTIGILAFIAISCFVLVELTTGDRKQKWYDEKYEASALTKKAHVYLKDIQLKNGEYLDNLKDPNETALVGQEYTQISTGRGSLPVKLSTTNPNFAGLVVALLKDANVKEGDVVAVCMTGSFPALNVATIAAIQTLKLNPIIVSSTTASTWGATDPYFTWLDMENALYKANILKFRSVAASIGGNEDIGSTLSVKGREFCKEAVFRNGLEFINGSTLLDNINKRMEYFKKYANGKPIKAFINVGDGMASLGSGANGKILPSGLNKKFFVSKLKDRQGVVYNFINEGVPVIHLLHLEKLMKHYKIPINPVPLPEVGEGSLFFSKKYNVVYVAIAAFVLLGSVIFSVIMSIKKNKLGDDVLESNLVIH